ncbi:MAG: hypothetical protein ACJ796_05180 [Gemmatimonadaceae bacterium]
MSFKTHTEGGGWLQGPATTVTNCNANEVTMVRAAFGFLAKTGQPCVAGIPGLGALSACLGGKSEQSLTIDCRGPSCGGSTLATGTAAEIDMCSSAFTSQAQADAALFHACVLSCGGVEIDAWALENNCYAGHGTRDPNANERDNLLIQGAGSGGSNILTGTFVTWNRTTGAVTVTSSGAPLSVNTQAYTGPLQLKVGGSWP